MNPIFEKEPLCFESPEKSVWKYVFHFKNAIAEAVLYRYNSFNERTVLCISVSSGCSVGCQFCGTGSKFIRHLTLEEISEQVDYILNDKNICHLDVDKFQLMFMSMGEPFLNYENVKSAIIDLNDRYPFAELLISTITPRCEKELKDFLQLSYDINEIGLQFSIHESEEWKRNILIPYKNKLTLAEIRDYGVQWWKETGRRPYLNYCVKDENSTALDFLNLRNMFPPNVFCFTFSVICSKEETMKEAGYRNLENIRRFEKLFIDEGYDTRVFNPEAQDSIGGGCGQLFYVQKYMKERL